jgi:hypothetical protein
MTESVHIRDCPICAGSLSIAFDKIDDSITIRPENLPPLVKDKLVIVNTYKRIKGLGSKWEKAHGARAIVYAGQLLEASGPLGGAVERCVGLLEWLAASGKDFDLGTASSYLMGYANAMAEKAVASRGRCRVCGEEYWIKPGIGFKDCGRHS